MVTPYFCFTAAAGKLSKVHMPSSASAGTLVQTSKTAKRYLKRMVRFSFGGGGGSIHDYVRRPNPIGAGLDWRNSHCGPIPVSGLFPGEAAVIAPFRNDGITGLARPRSALV